MASIPRGPGRGRYLISCTDSTRLNQFLSDALANPELQLLQTIGPPGAPHTAVYDMPHDTAAQLERQFIASSHLKIEPDRPLSLFGPSF